MGTMAEQELAIGQLVGSLFAMGYSLAFSKAQYSNTDTTLTWIAGRLTILHNEEAIRVEVKEEILLELSDDINSMLLDNVVKIDALRPLAGRAMCVASLVHVWRPFVAMLWGPSTTHVAEHLLIRVKCG